MWIFPHATMHRSVPGGPDIGISPHAIDHHSNWPAAEAIECHVNFPDEKSCDVASHQKYLAPCYYFYKCQNCSDTIVKKC